jgi:Fe-S-cluster containining protein
MHPAVRMEGSSGMSEPFYADGLRFSCTRCSRCCRLAPGFVFLTREDLSRLVQATGLPAREFVDRYCRQVGLNSFQRLSLKEKHNYDCIFWEEQGCTVYEHRPYQCRSYPFWRANLETRDTWEALKASCPGVGQGRLHSRREIEAWLKHPEGAPFLATVAEALR